MARTRIECATPEDTYLPLKNWHLIDTVSVKLEARYEGPSDLQKISRLSFLDEKRSADLDGVSGAPVFAFEQLDRQTVSQDLWA